MARRPRGHVLILDDDRVVCDFLGRALVELGIRVTVCHSEDGIGEIQQAGIQFDLIVATLARPDMPPVATIAHLGHLFPGVPLLHLEEVIPFSVEKFQETALKRMRREKRANPE